MTRPRVEWARWAGDLAGPRFAEFQTQLSGHNARRFRPGLPEEAASDELATDERVARAGGAAARGCAPDRRNPVGAGWIHRLTGPGQGDSLFPWLATTASIEQMRWFLF